MVRAILNLNGDIATWVYAAVVMKVTPYHYRSAEQGKHSECLFSSLTALCPPLRKGLRVLDVGSGNGAWSGWFSDQGCEVVAIDPSNSGTEIARQAYPDVRFEQLAVSEGICEELREDPFDLVISLEVVEHLYSPRQWAVGCFNALKPGGNLICSTPYHGYIKNLAISLANQWDRHWSPLFEGGHIKFWSRRTLTR